MGAGIFQGEAGMATESFTYTNVIQDDATAEKFIAALQASANHPYKRSSLIPDVEASLKRSALLLKQIFSPSGN